MNAKLWKRLVIVLFLLALLPGMTAAVAQGQEPASKAPLPAVTEIGESSPDVDWVNDETKYNDTMATAESSQLCNQENYFNCVLGGKIDAPGDTDYWALKITGGFGTHYPVLIDVDARSFGSPVDSVICLYADDGVLVGCNDDTGTYDSMLYFNFETGRTYYLRITEWGGRGGSDFKYQFYATTPLLISATTRGTVAGIPFQPGDVLAFSCEVGLDFCYQYDDTFKKWVMFLDLSDLGVAGNLSNLAAGWRNSDFLLVGFAANVTLPGISGPVTPWEVVNFNPSQIGPDTEGTFSRWWSGKDHGLTTTAEKLDAIDWPMWMGQARLYVSTTGTAAVPSTNIRMADEDIALRYWPPGERWERYFDGSRVDGLAVEDVVAMDVSDHDLFGTESDRIFMVIQGSGVLGVNLLRITQKDIVYTERYLENYWMNTLWHGPDWGWNYNIDAIDLTYMGETNS